MEGTKVEIRTDQELEVLHRLTGWAIEQGVPLVGLSVERLTLEDIYLRLTGTEPSLDAEASLPVR